MKTLRMGPLLAGISLLVLGCGFFWGADFYDWLRARRFSYLAVRNFEGQDFKNASFYAGRVWQMEPGNDKALGILSAIAREKGNRDALQWTALWVENQPRDPERLLALSGLLLSSGQLDASERVLDLAEGIEGVNQLALGQLRAVLHVRQGKPEEAERVYRTLLVQYPGKHLLAYNLANILILDPLPEKKDEGKKLLGALWKARQEPLLTARSILNLALSGERMHEIPECLEYLQVSDTSAFRDKLLVGSVWLQEQGTLPPQWGRDLAAQCTTPTDVYLAMSWFRKHGLQEQSRDWLDQVPQALKDAGLTQVARAELMAEKGEWEGLALDLEKENWGPAEHFRLAFIQEALLRGRKDNRQTPARGILWNRMIASLKGSPQDLFKLSEMMTWWDWPQSEKEQMLSELLLNVEIPPEKLRVFLKEAENRKDVLCLMYLAENLLAREPDNLVAINNLTYYRLLLQRDIPSSSATAAELYEQYPDNPAIRSTRIFALYRMGQVEEALALASGFTEKELQKPSQALCYGLILQKAGQEARAVPYLERARSADLFSEELELIRLPNI